MRALGVLIFLVIGLGFSGVAGVIFNQCYRQVQHLFCKGDLLQR